LLANGANSYANQTADVSIDLQEQDLAHPPDATRLTEKDYEQQEQQEPAPV
jgi:hypothetical protein